SATPSAGSSRSSVTPRNSSRSRPRAWSSTSRGSSFARPGAARRSPPNPVTRSSSGRRDVTRDLAHVHLVDLVRVEELPGVGVVDLLPHEDVEEIRVDVAVQLELAEYRQRLGERLALLVGPVLRRQRLEDVGDAHAARLDRHLLALQPPRIALAVH